MTEPIAPRTRLLRFEDVSERTGVPVETLRYWRKNDKGPKAARMGRRVVFREADVDAWVNEHFAD